MAILRIRPAHPNHSRTPLSLPRLPLTQSLPAFPSAPDSHRLLSERLFKSIHRKNTLSVIKSPSKPKPKLASLPPSAANLAKGMRLFHTLFGTPLPEKRPTKAKVVKLPPRFKESPLRRANQPEPNAPQGKTATSNSFHQLVLMSTTIRRPSSYCW